jgi:hypothetical protein
MPDYILHRLDWIMVFNATFNIIEGFITYLRYLPLLADSCVYFLFFFVLCLVYTMLPVSLDCPFLIAPSVFSNVCMKYTFDLDFRFDHWSIDLFIGTI